jgi:hypothetical protein
MVADSTISSPITAEVAIGQRDVAVNFAERIFVRMRSSWGQYRQQVYETFSESVPEDPDTLQYFSRSVEHGSLIICVTKSVDEWTEVNLRITPHHLLHSDSITLVQSPEGWLEFALGCEAHEILVDLTARSIVEHLDLLYKGAVRGAIHRFMVDRPTCPIKGLLSYGAGLTNQVSSTMTSPAA